MPNVAVPVARIQRWVDNFAARHGETRLAVDSGALTGAAADGSSFIAALPFEKTYAGPAEVEAFVAASAAPQEWGILLVRKGGFAIARMSGGEITDHKIGRRHVQGKTKAGGWSQQRFARRRANQASAAYEAAADHLLERVPALFLDYCPRPSLLHGDLWNGNAAMDAKGQPAIFDPAVYFGDRESDLAMSELFGGFAPDFYAAYREAWPLDAGYAVRKTLYNFYHILNHANLFGGGYATQAAHMAAQLLAQIR